MSCHLPTTGPPLVTPCALCSTRLPACLLGYLRVGVGRPVVEGDCGALENDRDLESEALSFRSVFLLFTVHSRAGCLTSLGLASLLEGEILIVTKWIVGV